MKTHTTRFSEAKKLIGTVVTAQNPGTFDGSNKVTGIIVSVRETFASYGDPRSWDVLVDIQHNGVVTPMPLDQVTTK